MGARGPAPKPTALEMLQGNPGRRSVNSREPKPKAPGTKIQPPAHLGPAAVKEWRRVRRVLEPVGLLTAADVDLLAMYCQAYQRWVSAEEQVKQFGEVVKTKAGNLIQNPYLSVANRAMDQMLIYARELGMTPSARSRLQVGSGEQPVSVAQDLFAVIQQRRAQRAASEPAHISDREPSAPD